MRVTISNVLRLTDGDMKVICVTVASFYGVSFFEVQIICYILGELLI